MDDNCFCDWDEPVKAAPLPVVFFCDDCEAMEEIECLCMPWFPNAAQSFKEQLLEDRRKSIVFKEKLKSINFTRVSGGGRA